MKYIDYKEIFEDGFTHQDFQDELTQGSSLYTDVLLDIVKELKSISISNISFTHTSTLYRKSLHYRLW